MMKWRIAATLAAAAGACLLSIQFEQADARPKKAAAKPAPVSASAPVAASAPPAPILPAGEPLAQAIQPYAAFQNDITDLQGGRIASAADLDRALDKAAAQNREALTKGWVAYGALTAAQSRDFIQGVRETAGFYGRDALVRGLSLDPAYAETLKGGPDASRLAMAASRSDGVRVFAVGEKYKQMAYDVQRQAWAKKVAAAQNTRLTRLRGLAAGAGSRTVAPDLAVKLTAPAGAATPWSDPTQFGGTAFWDSLRISAAPGGAYPGVVSTPLSSLRPHQDRVDAIHRMTTLAALYVLDATKEPSARAQHLMSDRNSLNCVEMAQAQFFQCMSAAHYSYENAFCLGEHALKDMGSCIRDSVVDFSPAASLEQQKLASAQR